MSNEREERVLQCGSALVAFLERDLPDRSSTAEEYQRVYACAGLLRGADLLGAALACLRAGRPDTVGVLVRTIVESWFTSVFLHVGGPEALARLEDDLNRKHRAMTNSNGLDLNDLLDERTAQLEQAAVEAGVLEDGDRFDRLSVEGMAMSIAQADASSVDAVQRYHLLYRTYSTEDAHGIAPILRRVDNADLANLRIRAVEPWIKPEGSIGLAALLLAELATSVLEDFGDVPNELAAILDELTVLTTAGAEEATANLPQHIKNLLPPDFISASGE